MYDRTIKKYNEPHSPVWIDKKLAQGDLNKGKFLSINHFHSYYLQMKTIYDLKVRKVLEIGPGENFTANYLKSLGIEYHTMDIIESSEPTILSNIEQIDEKLYKNEYDLVCAFQVLEHLPYELFKSNICKMATMSKKYVFISVPYACFGFKISINLHFNQNLRPTRAIKFSLPSLKKK